MADTIEDLRARAGIDTSGSAPDIAAQQAAIFRQRSNETSYHLEYWEDDSDPWDDLYLGADRMPGIWEVQSGEAVRDIDTKKAKDKDSARVRDLGGQPIKFSATGRLITRDQWRELQRVLPTLNPRTSGGLKSPVAIYHPAVALLGVTTVYITKVTAPKLDNGICEITIDMTEWSAPKPTKVAKTPAPAETPEQKAAHMKSAQLRKEYDEDYLGTLGKNLYTPKDVNNPDGEWRDNMGNKLNDNPPSMSAAKVAAPVSDVHGGFPEIIP